MVEKNLYRGFSKFVIAVIIIFSVSGVVYAEDGDIYNASNTNLGGIGNILLHNKSDIFNMIRNMSKYGYEVNNKIYNASEANDQFAKNPNETVIAVQKAIKANLIPKGDVPDTSTPISIGVVPDISSSSFGYDIATEIANPKYKGRLAGTDAYKASADYVSNAFQKLNLVPSGDNGSYLQKYSMNIAEYTSIPTLNIKDTELTFLKDFKLHGNTSSGTISSNETVFVGNGYDEDYSGISVTGKTVLLVGDTLSNKPMGILDRASLAKTNGASSVLIIPNAYMGINTFEKPIKYEGVSFPIFYITKDASKTYLGIDTSSATIGTTSNAKIKGNIALTKTSGASSYNVMGMVKGVDQSKTIVISASLDGFGSLPDGRTANGASTNAAAIGDICDLAKYYVNAKPECNILFVAFGSQAELMEGSKYFVNNYSNINNVIANIDVYDIGNPASGNMIFNCIDKNYIALHDAASKSGEYLLDTPSEVNYPFGNNYQFFTKNIPSMFIRYGGTTDSLNDNNIQIDAMTKVKTNIINIVTNLVPKQVVVDPSQPTKEYVASIDETMNVLESKYVKLYYEDNYEVAAKAAISGMDEIYDTVLWWNYNPAMPTEKYKVYCVDEWDEGWEVTNRLDKKGTGEQGGGYQSFTDYSMSIVRLTEETQSNSIFGTFAHEFNHTAANHTSVANNTFADGDNQEISGHLYAFSIGMNLNGNLKPYYIEAVSDLAPGKDPLTVDWSEFTANNHMTLTTPIQWTMHCDKLASVEYYIWKTYGKEVCRDIQYQFYNDPRPSVQSVLESKLNKDFDTIIKEWYAFYQ
ncbi:MAG: hypothetical protein ACI8WT_003658 [Clostridium sp.]|jgi:hypothetical protein